MATARKSVVNGGPRLTQREVEQIAAGIPDPTRRDLDDAMDKVSVFPRGAAADTTPPHLTAARSHLEVPANPYPGWPDTAGLYGTGAIAALERLDDAMTTRTMRIASSMDTLRLPPCVGLYRAEVLAWFEREGITS